MSAPAPTNPSSINPSALEPLFATWAEPDKHRVKADKPGDPAKVVPHRRPSPIIIAQNLRGLVRDWREAFYAAAFSPAFTPLLGSMDEAARGLLSSSAQGVDRRRTIGRAFDALDQHAQRAQSILKRATNSFNVSSWLPALSPPHCSSPVA